MMLALNLNAKVNEPKAVMPVPSEKQIRLQDMEMYAFIHYSLNTYTNQEWGYGNEDPALFNPAKLDARQWARTCKNAGMKGIIFTAKHHCGFCMWPSEYTDYSVKSSPWKNGKGDVVRELADACREEGLKFAVYLSPWDRNHPEYGRAEYVTYFHNQLEELLTNYGEIFEVWFDGANGGNGWYGGANETRQIDRQTYYRWKDLFPKILEWQPECCIWNDGSEPGDLRWVGTEAGYVGETNWSLMKSSGERNRNMLHFGVENGDVWVPGETNTSIRPGWFYHDSENGRVKSLAQLMKTYYRSVGRNSTLLLNFPVNKEGLIPQEDSIRAAAFYKMVKETFRHNLIKGAKISASNVRGGSRTYSAKKVADNKQKTYWATDDSVKSASITIELKSPTRVNRFLVSEYIPLGQRVKKFSLEAMTDGKWIELKDDFTENPDMTMSTIGRKRIICFPTIEAEKIRLTIIDAKACPLISEIGLYLAPEIDTEARESTEKKSAGYRISFKKAGGAAESMFIDLGGAKEVCGLRFLPHQKNREGTPLDYIVYGRTSDGTWKEVARGEFSNIINNPIWQDIAFESGIFNMIRLDCSRISSGKRIAYDDVEVVTPKK